MTTSDGMIQVAVLGATGSIGEHTLRVLARHPQRYRIAALSGFSRLDELAELVRQHQPDMVAVPAGQVDAFADRLRQLQADLPQRISIVAGEQGLIEIAVEARIDVVMAAIVGAAGLGSTLAAVQAGKRVLLANKESLVMAGELVMPAVRQHQAELLPVDSEHNAIFQCLPPAYQQAVVQGRAGQPPAFAEIRKLLLTASGGPFRGWQPEQLATVTPEQACRHPNWSMGRKISVDSATLMNKGLELIEACHLFGLPEHRIEVVVHRQSVIHSLVQFVDGSVLAELGQPDMCTPIASALAWPQRIDAGVPDLDLFALGRLDFEQPDEETFACLKLARQAMQTGGTAPAILNAANEEAVAAFLQGQVGFHQIAAINAQVLADLPVQAVTELAGIQAADSQARQQAHRHIQRLA